MAQIFNSDLFKELTNGAKLQTSKDSVPNHLADKVVPVMEVNPKLLRRISVVKATHVTTSTNTTIYTTPSDRDFYVCAITFSLIKDAACDMANGRVYVLGVINGENVDLMALPCLTLTAQNQSVTINFPQPIKIDRNTAISNARSGAHAAGTMLRSSIIYGYVDDVSTA